MCGRYAATRDPATLVAEFDATDQTEGGLSGADYNVAPGKDVLSVVQRHPRDASGAVAHDEATERSLRVMRWGLVPFWAKDPAIGNRMINTRVETAAEKPAFRTALARRRCLLPADGWFEWKAGAETTGRARARKQPYFMTPGDGTSLAFAGLWESWRDPNAASDAAPLVTFSILTTEAVGQLAEVHHRMPMLMAPEHWDAWLDPDSSDPGPLLEEVPHELVDTLRLRPVSTRVNNVRNNGPELVEPAAVGTQADDGGLFDVPSDTG